MPNAGQKAQVRIPDYKVFDNELCKVIIETFLYTYAKTGFHA